MVLSSSRMDDGNFLFGWISIRTSCLLQSWWSALLQSGSDQTKHFKKYFWYRLEVFFEYRLRTFHHFTFPLSEWPGRWVLLGSSLLLNLDIVHRLNGDFHYTFVTLSENWAMQSIWFISMCMPCTTSKLDKEGVLRQVTVILVTWSSASVTNIDTSPFQLFISLIWSSFSYT